MNKDIVSTYRGSIQYKTHIKLKTINHVVLD
jgi:hypothetical protein